MLSCYRLQRSWGKVMFLQASVILLTGGGYLTRYPPDQVPLGPGTPPWDQVNPPRTRYTPRGPGTPPWDQVTLPRTTYTPQDQVHPLGPGTLPLGPGTPLRDQVHPPGTRYILPGPGTPTQDQVHPLRPGTPPRHRACWEIRSMHRRTVRILLECNLVG